MAIQTRLRVDIQAPPIKPDLARSWVGSSAKRERSRSERKGPRHDRGGETARDVRKPALCSRRSCLVPRAAWRRRRRAHYFAGASALLASALSTEASSAPTPFAAAP